MWLNEKMLGPRPSQQTYFLLYSGQTPRDKALSTVLIWRQRSISWNHQPSFWRWVWASTCCPYGLFPMSQVGCSSSFRSFSLLQFSDCNIRMPKIYLSHNGLVQIQPDAIQWDALGTAHIRLPKDPCEVATEPVPEISQLACKILVLSDPIPLE